VRSKLVQDHAPGPLSAHTAGLWCGDAFRQRAWRISLRPLHAGNSHLPHEVIHTYVVGYIMSGFIAAPAYGSSADVNTSRPGYKVGAVDPRPMPEPASSAAALAPA
jgi:hypothetical protein